MNSENSENIEIIYQDRDLFVVNKPANLLSVPGKGAEKFDSVQSRCAALKAGSMAVHRLDMATSGILLIAKHKEAERHYKRLFAERLVRKRYVAVVYGEVTQDQGEIDFPLICDWENRPRQKICYETGKPSLTFFKVVARENGYSRLLLTPHTGRSHQLRVHLAGMGYPIVGDEFYSGDQGRNEPRLLLHAQFLAAEHPTGLKQEFFIPAPF